jgi:hypothetical protein
MMEVSKKGWEAFMRLVDGPEPLRAANARGEARGRPRELTPTQEHLLFEIISEWRLARKTKGLPRLKLVAMCHELANDPGGEFEGCSASHLQYCFEHYNDPKRRAGDYKIERMEHEKFRHRIWRAYRFKRGFK